MPTTRARTGLDGPLKTTTSLVIPALQNGAAYMARKPNALEYELCGLELALPGKLQIGSCINLPGPPGGGPPLVSR
jgi:hypothetical protein